MAVQPGSDFTPIGLSGTAATVDHWEDTPYAVQPIYATVQPGAVFVMRAVRSTDGLTVYWNTPYPDLNGELYPNYTGTLSKIVVSNVAFWQQWTHK